MSAPDADGPNEADPAEGTTDESAQGDGAPAAASGADPPSQPSSSRRPRIGVVTVSDRASRGEYEDRGGPAVRSFLDDVLAGAWQHLGRVVPDERHAIEAALLDLVDERGCCLVVTTGGTGPGPRDVTPEATAAVCEKLLPGFGEVMRRLSFARVPTTILSRQTAGVRGRALLLNLPGQPRAIAECLGAVFPAIPHAIDILGGPRLETDSERLRAPRPHVP